MQFPVINIIITVFFYALFHPLKAETISSEEVNTKYNNLAIKVDSIKTRLKSIETEVQRNYETEKLLWQLEAFELWYQDDESTKCMHDLTYIFKGWSAIQRRFDGSENFYRNWSDYKRGFGDKNKEFFMGLEQLHQLTSIKEQQELLIILGDHNKHVTFAKYDKFVMGSEEQGYVLKELGAYTGTAGDALREQVGNKFTTLDRDNDNSTLHNCAKLWRGAWWFGYCYQSHLNGPYLEQPVSEEGQKGIVWDLWHGMSYSLKYSLMLVRSKP